MYVYMYVYTYIHTHMCHNHNNNNDNTIVYRHMYLRTRQAFGGLCDVGASASSGDITPRAGIT